MAVVLITGCSRGIGHALALALAGRGWTVVATLRDGSGRAALQQAGVQTAQLDVTDLPGSLALVAEIVARHGRLDAVVASAGRGLTGCFEDLDPDQVRDIIEVNVFGAMNTVRAALPAVRAARGRVVLISSIAGTRSAPGSSAYSASKFALEGFGESLRHELAPFGVQVVMIEPGATATGFVAARGVGARTGTGTYAAISGRLRQLLDENSADPEPVSVVVDGLLVALEGRRPPFRIPTGRGVRAQILARRLLPWRAYERLVRTKLALPKP